MAPASSSTSLKNFLIATSNTGKFQEILEVLHSLPFHFLSFRDVPLNHDFEEDGDTFEQNALKKARHYFEQTPMMTLGEDSGILVDALPSELGVKTRRWGAGEKATDEEWIDYFFHRMREVPLEKRTARFVCSAAVIDEKGRTQVFRGESEGVITFELQAPITKGIPLSSCFRPKGYEKVFAALDINEKNRISHRGKAMSLVKAYLESLL